MDHGFHKLVTTDIQTDKSVENLRECLDNWSTKTTKNKRKKKKGKEEDDEESIKEQGDGFKAEIEVLGKLSLEILCKLLSYSFTKYCL